MAESKKREQDATGKTDVKLSGSMSGKSAKSSGAPNKTTPKRGSTK